MSTSKLCFNDLPNEMVNKIFTYLPVNQLLATETVSHRWRECVTKTLDRVTIFAFDKPNPREFSDTRCRHFRRIDLTKTLIFYPKISLGLFQRLVSSAQVDKMLPLLKRCPNIECLSLEADEDIEFSDIETLTKLMKALPNVECLYYGNFKIGAFDHNDVHLKKWLSFCRDIGPRFRHLIIKKLWEWKPTIEKLLAASVNLKCVHLTSATPNQVYLELLRKLTLGLPVDFNALPEYEIDVKTAAIIGQTESLSILFPWLRSAARHCQTFDRLNWLRVDYTPFDCPVLDVEFPALEHLIVYFDIILCPKTMISQLAVYNLANLKSLSITSRANDSVLRELSDELKSLKKLTLKSCLNQLPGESLLRLSQLKDLHISNVIRIPDDLPQVVELFNILAKLRQLKRCKIDFRCTYSLNQIPDDFIQQLNQAKADLRQALPLVEINFPLDEWLNKAALTKLMKRITARKTFKF